MFYLKRKKNENPVYLPILVCEQNKEYEISEENDVLYARTVKKKYPRLKLDVNARSIFQISIFAASCWMLNFDFKNANVVKEKNIHTER